MKELSWTILGSSAGMPQRNRISTGHILHIDDRLILFDCGGGISSSFCRFGFNPLAVEQIFISHTHPDHISDLPLFIQMLYLSAKSNRVTLHVPEEAVQSIRDYFNTLYLFDQKMPFLMDFVPIINGSVIESEDISVSAIQNMHFSGSADIIHHHGYPNKMQSFSYLIHAGDLSILYSGDLGSEKDLDGMLRDVDLLIVESTHIDIDGLLDLVIESKVGRVILSHIAEDFPIEQTKQMAQKRGYHNLYIAEDGFRLDLL